MRATSAGGNVQIESVTEMLEGIRPGYFQRDTTAPSIELQILRENIERTKAFSLPLAAVFAAFFELDRSAVLSAAAPVQGVPGFDASVIV